MRGRKVRQSKCATSDCFCHELKQGYQ
uniref:Uncharacterized protein n=1 Tax=Rhizophora mucronata TaxID=61149 RepID=A0A2P2N1N9_RHIMU